MKKNILIVLTLILIAFMVVKAKSYYENRYVVNDIYYTKVNADISLELEDLYDQNGDVADTGKNYSFVAYNEAGDKRIVEFSINTENADDLLQPDDYIKIEHSKTLVLSYSVVNEDEVPQSIIKVLE